MMHLHIFVPTSPPLSSISIKGVLLIDTKDCIGVDGWYLNLAFFYGHHHIWWNDTTYSPWDTSCRIFDLDTNRWGTSPYSMGHPLDTLELLYMRELASLDNHLKLRITCGTTIWCARNHVYECHL
jgi:hypothetical protein